MSADTLVLNKGYYAVHVISWQRAMSLLYQGNATALDQDLIEHSFNDWKELSALMQESPSGFVSTINYRIAIPEVIKLTRFDKLPKAEVKFTRKNIYQHYHFRCCYCGQQFRTEELNLDHVIPRSKGGPTDWTNIVTACVECNSAKRDRTPEEAKMKLLVPATKPRWKGSKSLLDFSSTARVKNVWQRLIDAKYWSTELERS